MSQLNNNTATLNELLELAQNLPEAGSGGGSTPETCTVNITWGKYFGDLTVTEFMAHLQYIEDGNIKMYSVNLADDNAVNNAITTFTVPKNAIASVGITDYMYPEAYVEGRGSNSSAVVPIITHPAYSIALAAYITGDTDIAFVTTN